MRVALVTAAFPPMKAGEAEHMYHLHAQLVRREIDVRVITSREWGPSDESARGVAAIVGAWSWRDALVLARALKAFRPDAVLLYYIGWIYHHHPMVTFLPTLCKRLFSSCRVATMFAYPEGSGGDQQGMGTRALRRVVSLWAGEPGGDYEFGTLLRDSDAVILMSELHRPQFAKHSADIDRKAVLVPPAPLLHMATGSTSLIRADIRARLGLPADAFVFAYFGFIYPAKGIETILQAFALVRKAHPRASLLMVGGELVRPNDPRPNYGQEMRGLSHAYGCGGSVHWTGGFATDSDEASRYLYAADAGVFGHDLGVAMNNSSFAALVAHRLPTVATYGPVLEPQLKDGDNVLLCPPKDPSAMAQAMDQLLRQPELRERLALGARQLADEWFSWEQGTERILRALGSGTKEEGCSR